ncbi:MAG TPA: TRAP transporter substrate-binding protein [Ramlibacter sp.]|nr:TRAP transporter substrate-binding protein [Ramlibacter sp.]
MKIERRTFLKAAAGLGAGSLLHFPAYAAEFTYKLGHNNAVTHPQHLRLVEASRKIAEESRGRLVVEIYPSSQLGSDPQMLAQLRSGALELAHMGDIIIGNLVPVASLAALPFAFADSAALWRAMDGALGKFIHAEIERKLGLHVFDRGWDGGVRHLFTSQRPVRGAADLKGMKFRVPSGALAVSLFKGLGASPTTVPSAEVYTALQTRLVDGAEGPLVTIESSKLYEATRYISLTGHMHTPFEMLASGAAWARLPKDLQGILARQLDAAALLQRADIARGDGKLQEVLKERGQTFIEPDRASFREALRQAGLYGEWRDAYGGPEPFGLLEQATGKLI